MIEDGNLYDAIYAVGIMMNDGNRVLGTAFRAYYTDRLWSTAHVTATIAESGASWFDGVSGLQLDAESYYHPNLLLEQ